MPMINSITTTIQLHGNITYHVDGQNIGPAQAGSVRHEFERSTGPLDNDSTIKSRIT